MTFPANYAVIAEDELTYVTGGGVIANVLPAVMTSENWRTFSTNLIKIIGNSSMKNFLGSTVGVLFGGSFSFDNWGTALEGAYWKGFDTVDKGLNTVLSWVGALASIYTLGTADAKTLQGDKVLKIDGTTF